MLGTHLGVRTSCAGGQLESAACHRTGVYQLVSLRECDLAHSSRLPYSTAGASATIAGASRVQLLQERVDGWSHVQVAQAHGYVKSDYLVETQEAVTADIDWTKIAAAGGEAYSSLSPLAASAGAPTHSATTRQVAPKVTTGPKVYICSNGRTEVYHSTESCAAMRRCTYQTLVMSQREAQASGLRGCMKCD